MITRIDMPKGNRMVRVGFGQHDGKWFFRLDIWAVGYRLTKEPKPVSPQANADDEEEEVDDYGNPLSGDRLINCCFPDCGCDGARLCMAENGASSSACMMNIERGTYKGV